MQTFRGVRGGNRAEKRKKKECVKMPYFHEKPPQYAHFYNFSKLAGDSAT
jgi:hypothetical protein